MNAEHAREQDSELRWFDPKMRVKKWMSAPVHRVARDTPVDDAFALMRKHSVRHLAVMDGDQLVGVVTDRNLRVPPRIGRPWSVAEAYIVGRDLDVSSVMTTPPITVEPSDTTAYAARLMTDNRIGCLPVVSVGKVVGMLTNTDLLAALAYAIDPAATSRNPGP